MIFFSNSKLTKKTCFSFGPITSFFSFSTAQIEKKMWKYLVKKIGENMWWIRYYKEPDSPVLSYQNQIEDIHVDTDTLKKWANFAHDFRQLPFLCQGRIELERCAEKGNHYVAEGQVSNQNVVYILQGFCSANNPQNQSIAITWCGNRQPVNQNQESDQT